MFASLARYGAGCCLALLLSTASHAEVSVTDDSGSIVTLPSGARRIVSLAPHATELLFAAGAGKAVVAVTEFSDYPEQARRLPSAGNGQTLDLERILQFRPDLVVAWNTGAAARQLDRLQSLGVPVYRSEPRDFEAVAASLERLARLAGTEAEGKAAAHAFRTRLSRIREEYSRRRKVTVFYQVWRAPLMTLNGSHMVSAALRLCAGDNIFAALPQTAPTVSEEAVIKADPEAIIASSGGVEDAFAGWKAYTGMKAVARGNLVAVDGSLLNRSGPRVLDGTERLCRTLDTMRAKR